MNLSFRELSAMGSALILAVIAWNYFPDAFLIADGGELRMATKSGYEVLDKSSMLFWFGVGTIVTLIVFEIIYHIVLATRFREEANTSADERDRMVMSKARRNSYYVLDIGALFLVGHLYLTEPSGLMAAQFLLLLLVTAELVKYLSIVVFYRLSI